MLHPEKLLHFAWKFRLFRQDDLRLVNGDPLYIQYPGLHNRDAGPDFLNARLRIAETGWAGTVEIHRCSSDWTRHGHDKDPAYRNVLIHVVEAHDTEIRDLNGRILPTLELGPRLYSNLLHRWKCLEEAKQSVPCRILGKPDPLIARSWLDRMLAERLESREGKIMQLLQLHQGNWQEAFYIWFARAFGFHVNAIPFEMLALSLPLPLVMGHIHSRFQLEALLFGQSGLLPESPDLEYPLALKTEYAFLQHKYSLRPLEKHIWKFLRMRPGNFPTLRIAQFAACLELFPGMLQSLIDGEALPDFKNADVSPYWKNQLGFERKSARAGGRLGTISHHILINNVLAPFLFVYGKNQSDWRLIEKALDIFRLTKAEQNHVTAIFREFFPESLHGGDTQAMLHLKEAYCDRRRCTECGIGQHLLGRDQSLEK